MSTISFALPNRTKRRNLYTRLFVLTKCGLLQLNALFNRKDFQCNNFVQECGAFSEFPRTVIRYDCSIESLRMHLNSFNSQISHLSLPMKRPAQRKVVNTPDSLILNSNIVRSLLVKMKYF